MALTFPNNFTSAYNELVNGSVLRANTMAYEIAWGVWFWPLIYFLFLVMIALKSESPGPVVIYSVVGNVALGVYLIPQADKIFYVVLVLSLAMLLYKVFGSKQD